MKKLLRRGALVGALGATAYAIWRLTASNRGPDDGVRFEPQPAPLPPRPVAPERTGTPVASRTDLATVDAAVEPDADGNCPLTHPIKGKLASGIYHRPGAFAYDRTRADRCYRDETAAQDDGLRAAKR